MRKSGKKTQITAPLRTTTKSADKGGMEIISSSSIMYENMRNSMSRLSIHSVRQWAKKMVVHFGIAGEYIAFSRPTSCQKGGSSYPKGVVNGSQRRKTRLLLDVS